MTPIGQPIESGDNIYCVTLSPDGTVLATASAGHNLVRLYDITDKSRPRPIGQGLTFRLFVRAVAISPDGNVLAVGGNDQTISLWRLR
ncbi:MULTISPECIES: WD40 repeat domain-containing protein [Pseudofrankia]|uniref:WD40 repeat domain-containing protein n=1 Tax=Pseudofrankia TaxID=2994363 RepID=UPI000234BD57|nr:MULTISPECIES: hypothetical protein [Pseudofrankia]OHV37023.1 hypothetical protein BCD49_17450 [Pseudofrankia sp. EUN1h]